MSTYRLLIEPEVHDARGRLPGQVRQRIKRTIADLAIDPRAPGSTALDARDLEVPEGVELRRLRLEHWRIVYAVNDAEQWVWILAVHQRPPYTYADLAELIARLG